MIFSSAIVIALLVLRIVNPVWSQLVFAFPLGLTMLAAEPLQRLDPRLRALLMVPLMAVPYLLYILLLTAMLFVRRWRTFGVVSLSLLCLLLLNLAGCGKLIESLSHI